MMKSILRASLRRPRSPLLSAVSARYSSSHHGAEAISITSTGFQGSEHQSIHSNWFALSAAMTAAAAASAASTATFTSQCESEPPPTIEATAKTENNDDEQEEEVDPYDNLPVEDEPTNCSICLTYRQGPCRPYWRKVEACTKDNELKKDDDKESDDDKKSSESNEEEEEEADPPCLKYMLPWIDCASGFRNLYNLIELDTNYTIGIADLEKDASKNLCWAASSTPSVDWSAWAAYREENPDWKLPVTENSESPENASLWKTLDQSKDPVLVEVVATVNLMEDEGILECAYAQDQGGHVIGFQYGTKPSEAFDTEKKEEGEEEAKQGPTATLKIRILPERTQTVTIAASYTQPPSEEQKESKDLKKDSSFHSFIFKSKPIVLDQVELPKTEKNEDEEES
ncbi:unnamed protein product [Cylindrotheca closterium]|uniref:Uncharacterized protein n=1 Tax=Cylindrotheca closterium TaxID=2856 RepID=A0AAD2G5H6_9STRA|nr:unnamed protein product [Cylindrotheca closterium]